MNAEHLTLNELAAVGFIVTLSLSALAAEAREQAPKSQKDAIFEATVEVDFGKDVGQNLGSLFEVSAAGGRVVLGAGFQGVYNTQFRAARYKLQFFLRPGRGEEKLEIERLPRPNDIAGVYLFDLDGKLYAWSHSLDTQLRLWNEVERRWDTASEFDLARASFGDGVVRVGRGVLQFAQSSASFDGTQVLAPPAEGRYHNPYYANGHLVFYHTRPGDGGYTRVCACPWTPERETPIDLAEARTIAAKYVGETPFAFGQLRGHIVTCSNNGGFYVFDGQNWQVLREADKQVSYQIYSMVNYYDRLFMGQYPSGNLLEYDGDKITPLKDWPPVLPGVASSAREAQTAVIYRGELWVGVWPWAELWRYDEDTQKWVSMGRAFTRPELTDKFQHPYEKDLRDYNQAHGTDIVINLWGHRVASMVPMGDSLMVSTSAKGPVKRDPRLSFLTDEVYSEYGQVLRVRLPGNLAVTVSHAAKPTKLKFTVTRNRMAVSQDGRLLGSAALDPHSTADVKPGRITWAYGIFGPLQGRLKSKSVAPALKADAPYSAG